MDFVNALVTGLLGTKRSIRMDVFIPPGCDPMDLYKVFKDAAELEGVTLSNFVVEEESP